MNLGGQSRKYDPRDVDLGAVQPPGVIPESYKTDVSWLNPIWQDGTPACGAHAGAHLKMILDHDDPSADKIPYSPNDLWREIKLIDGHAPEEGTDMRAILKTLANKGVSDYSLMPNVFPVTLQEYTDPSKLTQAIRENALPRQIKAYGFDTPAQVNQAIYHSKAALILLDVGDSWWGHEYIEPFTKKDGGHFVVGTQYDPNDGTFVVDSADKSRPFKWLSPDYPIREVGTAIDIPDSEVKALIAKRENLYKFVAILQSLQGKPVPKPLMDAILKVVELLNK